MRTVTSNKPRRLYHYTIADRVEAIRLQGLKPHVEAAMSPMAAVVWLTEQPDVKVMPKAARWLAQNLGLFEGDLADLQKLEAGEIEQLSVRPLRAWWYGSKGQRLEDVGPARVVNFTTADDDLVRLTVEVPAGDPALQHYATWRLRPHHNLPRGIYRLPHIRQWFVYPGEIKPQWITEVSDPQQS